MIKPTKMFCMMMLPLLPATAFANDQDQSVATIQAALANASIELDVAPPSAAEHSVKAQKKRSGRMLDDAELDEFRGGETVIVAAQSFSGLIQGNINGDVNPGDITLSDNAFSNFNGLGNITINTAPQSLLQSGINLIINVTE